MQYISNNIQKIALFGNAGSGKSTLAQELHKMLNIPVYHLDQYYWKPNWQRLDIEDFKVIHDNLCNQDEWIIDGMHLKIAEPLIKNADVIIFFDIPVYTCVWRIFKRLYKYYGTESPSSAPGCIERVNLRFLKFMLWVLNFNKNYRNYILNLIDQDFSNQDFPSKQVYIIKNQQDIKKLLKTLAKIAK